MTRLITCALFLAFCTPGLQAQTQSFEGYIAAADRSAQRDDHYNAYRLYAIAAEEDWSDDAAYAERIGEVYYKAGTAAYRATAYGEAERYLIKLRGNPAVAKYPLLDYYMGQAVFRQGRYDQAAAHFQRFLDEQPRAPENYRAIALTQISDADWAIDKLAQAGNMTLNHLPTGINTEDSDIMYMRGPDDTRFYTSNNFEFKKDSLTPHRMLSRIMKQSGEAEAVPLPASINLPGKNVAHTAFNASMQQVYYSVCDFRNYDEMRCDLYRATVAENGDWTNPTKLDLNVAGYSTTQPTVGLHDDGNEYLYFASDRPGGKGGLDIYRAVIENGTPGVPEAVAGVNSAGDEASPFFYSPRRTLFFATNGRSTLGGLDLYKSYLVDGEYITPRNMGAPINSAADDAYYTQFDDPATAYIGSRRPSDEAIYYSAARDVCCYDLYEFTPDPRLDLLALTFNGLTDEELEGATVKLFQIIDGRPVLVDEVTNLRGNDFDLKVEPGQKYLLVAEKDGFTQATDELDLSAPEFENVAYIERRLDLNPKVDLDVYTFNNVDEKALAGTTVKLFEVDDDGELTLVTEITNPDANDSHFELEIGKRYFVEASKPGFGQATTEIDLLDYNPNTGSATLRRDLYLGQFLEVYVIDGFTDEPLNQATVRLTKIDGKLVGEDTNLEGNDFYYTVNLDQPFVLNTQRAGYFPRTDTLRFSEQDLIDGDGVLVYYVPLFSNDLDRFLPFEVYFDNDYPDPDSYSTRTQRSYAETYGPYLDRKPAFIKNASEGLSEEQAFLTRGDINQFFEQEVEAGYQQLQRFSEALLLHLENKGTYTMQLQGYASPRSPEEYNRRLSARRIMSLKNYFRTYRGGVLAKYIDGKQLKFTEAALGETTANLAKIYERIDLERESIYSTAASLERRVTLRSGLRTSKK